MTAIQKAGEEIGNAIAAERNAELIRPFEDVRVIAGQGTIGLEIAAQCADAGAVPDHVISCCGGGGLIAGVSLAVSSQMPGKNLGSEPEGFDDTIRSLETGQIQSVDPANRSICDAVVTPSPGEITFGINSQTLAGGFAVSDALVLRVMATAFKHLKLVIEPGAVALAAALDKRLPPDTSCAVAVASGGNVDPQMFERALAAGSLF